MVGKQPVTSHHLGFEIKMVEIIASLPSWLMAVTCWPPSVMGSHGFIAILVKGSHMMAATCHGKSWLHCHLA